MNLPKTNAAHDRTPPPPAAKRLTLEYERGNVSYVRRFACPPGKTADQVAATLMAAIGQESDAVDAAQLYYLTDDAGQPVPTDKPLWDHLPGEEGRFRVRRRDTAGRP